jgi:hypothetical protein
MPRRRTEPQASSAQSPYTRLEHRLVLLAWLHRQFGFQDSAELVGALSDTKEGFDAEGQSFLYHALIGRGCPVGEAALARYDENIRAHLAAMNAQRPDRITLRYFQYLAALYSEFFLDWRANHSGELVRHLNAFVRERNAVRLPGEPTDRLFALADLSKLAFLMATGSGKTLLLHLNYRQFLHYYRGTLDNILLIAPNEGLSQQHLSEFEHSGIPARRFNPEDSGLLLGESNVVQVLEITKLVTEKKGSGVTVPVEAFEGNNLIFVDEGHKGTGGEAWRSYRDSLGRTGFTFEYSATFVQALTASRDEQLTMEYGQAIGFDYSYKFFYGDGYGKDFHILNLREESTPERTDSLLLGNLLAFYEQLRLFDERRTEFVPYNLERPLWAFVGSSVTTLRSDVLTVVRFFERVLRNERGWATLALTKLLEGRSGLHDTFGQDLFADRYKYLRNKRLGADRVYNDILRRVLGSPAAGALHLSDIAASAGELGLRVGGADGYFGLIYIGDTATFKRLVEAEAPDVVIEEDAISPSLLAHINGPSSPVNVLIGAKKFMEGWNSWRVSSMGLLNIGRSEGSEIIQFFGRGVRLKGRAMSLKRSQRLPGDHPRDLPLLETLDIFALRANYMAQFRDYLEREGVDPGGSIELALPIRTNQGFLDRGLVAPQVLPNRDFTRESSMRLAPDAAAKVQADVSLRAESLRSGVAGVQRQALRSGEERTIPRGSLDLVSWDRLYLRLLEYKDQKGYGNLAITPKSLRQIIEADDPMLYRLIADEETLAPRSFAGILVLEEAILTVLRKYLERYYYVQRERWESKHMGLLVMDRQHPNFRDYTIKLPRSDEALVRSVMGLIGRKAEVYQQDSRELPALHFDRHLYQPLVLGSNQQITSDPPGLNEHEEKFVYDLRQYVRDHAEQLCGKELFLLRNLSRGKGIGFFESQGFYPDFLLWVVEGQHQRLIFVEPHGLKHAKAYWSDDKARLHERLRKLGHDWRRVGGLENVTVDAFIVSATGYDEIRSYYDNGTWTRDGFAERHVLFCDRGPGYIGSMLESKAQADE